MNRLTVVYIATVAIALAATSTAIARPSPLGTAFTYQGQLKQGGSAVNATADFQFSLWDAVAGPTQIGATQAVNAVAITDGLFTVQLDFGASAFGTSARWLEIAVRSPAGGGAFNTLSPRQPIRPAPVAQFALGADGPSITNLNASNISTGTLPSSAFSGNYSGMVNFTNPGNTFGGFFNGSGAGLNNLNAGNIVSGILAIAQGGTGAASAAAALSNLNAQARVTGVAPRGSYVRAINADGSVVTGVDQDTNTTYSAGAGLQLSGTVFSVANNGVTNVMLANDAQSLPKVSGGTMTANPVFGSVDVVNGNFTVTWTPAISNINPVAIFRTAGATSSAGAIRVQNSAGNGWGLGITPTNDFSMAYNNNISLASDLLVMKTNGNLGVGTTNPTSKLHIGGVPGTDGIRFPDNTVQTTSAQSGRMVNSGFAAGAIAATIPSLLGWQFVGPTTNVTIASGQRLIVNGAAPIGLTVGSAVDFNIDVGYRLMGSGAVPTNAAGTNYMIARAVAGPRTIWPVNANISGLPAGTYEVGIVVNNLGNSTALNLNDFTNMTWMLFN